MNPIYTTMSKISLILCASHYPGEYTSYAVTDHNAAVTDLSIHALGTYFVSASMDGTWALHDMNKNKCLTHITDSKSGGNTAVSFHPDGLLLGIGTANSVITIWDMKQPEKAATQLEGHKDKIASMEFSENGCESRRGWIIRVDRQQITIQASLGHTSIQTFCNKTSLYLHLGQYSI